VGLRGVSGGRVVSSGEGAGGGLHAGGKMRAAAFFEHGGPEVLGIVDLPVPEPGPGEVRIRVRASSLNHLDLWVRRGLPYPVPLPHVGGADLAGEVEAVGPGVQGIPPGLRVVVDPSLHWEWYAGRASGNALPSPRFQVIGEHVPGGFAEFAVVPAANLVELPEGVTFDDAAAAALVTVTAWRGLLSRGGLRPGERVLVTGASGGVGTAAVQVAREAGARVIALTSGDERVERVRELGAEVVVDRSGASFEARLREATAPRGVDLVFDSVGDALWGLLVRSLRPGGRLVTCGATTGPEVETDLRHVFWKQLSILGTTMGSPDEFRAAMSLVFRGRVRPVVDRVYPLEAMAEAHRLLEAGEVFGKVGVRI